MIGVDQRENFIVNEKLQNTREGFSIYRELKAKKILKGKLKSKQETKKD